MVIVMKNIQRISALVATLLAATLLLCSCGKNSGSSPELGWKEISNDGVSYNLYVPDEWISDVSTGMTSAYVSNADNSNVSMIAFDLKGGEVTTVADYWKTYEPGLEEIFTDFTYVSEADKTKLGGVDALAYTYTGTVAGTEYKIMQVVAFKDAQVYIFTYTATADRYDTHFEDVFAILGFFEFN